VWYKSEIQSGRLFLAFGIEFSLSVCQLAFITYTDTHLLGAVIRSNTALQNDSNYTAEANQSVRYNTVNFNRPLDHGMIPVRIARDPHANHSMVNDDLLLSILTALSRFTPSLRATQNA
jgi:hypothetical protein